jgi:hypothetical protein
VLGQILVDGEVLPSYGPIRVEVHKGLARLLCNGFAIPALPVPVEPEKADKK